jgi:hypothetical protein
VVVRPVAASYVRRKRHVPKSPERLHHVALGLEEDRPGTVLGPCKDLGRDFIAEPDALANG